MRSSEPWIRWLTPPALVLTSLGPAHAETYLSVEEAQRAIFPGHRLTPAGLTLTPDQAKAIEKVSGVRVRVRKLSVWRVEGGGLFVVDAVLGKHEYITWALGLNADGSVKQIEILEYRETYGYEVREPKWKAQFYGKKHGATLKLDDDIKNISGATLSCRHIADGVKRLLATYEIALKS
jgi:Na+-transporting NADH:ubiquinone oxidoreductase subunit NqrC